MRGACFTDIPPVSVVTVNRGIKRTRTQTPPLPPELSLSSQMVCRGPGETSDFFRQAWCGVTNGTPLLSPETIQPPCPPPVRADAERRSLASPRGSQRSMKAPSSCTLFSCLPCPCLSFPLLIGACWGHFPCLRVSCGQTQPKTWQQAIPGPGSPSRAVDVQTHLILTAAL